MKYQFNLNGLHCAGCAAKMEHNINEQNFIEKATVNFTTSKLTLVFTDDSNVQDNILKIEDIVKSIEPDVTLERIDSNKHVHEVCHDHDCNCTHDHNNSHEHNHNHSDEHEHHHNNKFDKKTILTIIIGTVFLVLGLTLKVDPNIKLALFTLSYLIIGGKILLNAIKGLFKGRIIDEGILMTIASLSAFYIGEYPEAVAVMLFYNIGQIMEGAAVNHSRNSISSLISMKPDYANLKTPNGTKKVAPESVNVGDLLIVITGERVPVDGKIKDGKSAFDTSAITGESIPQNLDINETVYSGFINTGNVVTIEVTKKYEESTIAKILDLVENSADKKANTEKFMTKFAKYYTPAVVIVALLITLVPSLFLHLDFSKWLYRGAVFLVVSCPCALVISIPLGYFAGIGKASSKGILVKGGNYLEALSNIDSIVFDKTGTLTKGNFVVTSVKSVGNMKKDELIFYAAHAEAYSNHPIGKSIKQAYVKNVNEDIIKDYKEKAGHGVEAVINENLITAGNARFMKSKNISIAEADEYGTVIYLAVNEILEGYIVIADEVKEDSIKAIKELKNLNLNIITMLTGDNQSTALKVASKLGISNVHANLLPADKVELLEAIQAKNVKGRTTGFVGDGINDAPVLARSDIGFAMGGLGSDAAIEASDIVLMTDEVSKIPQGIKIARKTKSIIWQNIILALGIKLGVMVLGTLGLANMWQAVFADVGVTILAILNALRILKKNY